MPLRVGVPSHPHSFLIEKRGNSIVAQDSRGRIQYSGTDAASVIQSAINSLSNGGKIFFKPGTYYVNSPLQIPDTAGLRLSLEGVPHRSIIEHTEGTLDYLVQDMATSWRQGVNARLLWIEGLDFKIKTKDANTVGLKLQFITSSLKDVRIMNTNTTRQGIGILAGNGDGLSPAGAVWNNIIVSDFGYNYKLDLDHLVGNFLFSQDPSIADFSNLGSHITLVNPQAFRSVANITTAKRFLVSSRIVIINPYIEKNSGGAVCFERLGDPGYKALVYGLTLAGGVTDPVVSSSSELAYIKIYDSPDFITSSERWAAFPIDSTGLKTVTIAHGLSFTPLRSEVQLTIAKDTDVSDWRYDTAYVSSTDSTNVYVRVYVSQASATVGAVARAVIKCGLRSWGS